MYRGSTHLQTRLLLEVAQGTLLLFILLYGYTTSRRGTRRPLIQLVYIQMLVLVLWILSFNQELKQ